MMNEILFLLKKAKEQMNIGDHMLYMTYPILKENKLIISIAENIYNAMLYSMDALLMYERMYKRILSYPDKFSVKLEILRKISPRYNLNKDIIPTMQDLKIFLDERKNSRVEFSKNDKYVLFNQKQELRSLGIEKLKQNLNISKNMVNSIEGILSNAGT